MSENLIIPIVRILDNEKAKAFYVDFLQFKVDWEHRFAADFPVYMQISKNGWVIHLNEHAGDSEPGVSMMLTLKDVRALHAELTVSKGEYSLPECEETDWDTITLTIVDPFGNTLIFTQNK